MPRGQRKRTSKPRQIRRKGGSQERGMREKIQDVEKEEDKNE